MTLTKTKTRRRLLVFVIGDNLLSRSLLAANQLAIRFSKSLFSYQIYVEATATPNVEFVLRDSRTRAKDFETA